MECTPSPHPVSLGGTVLLPPTRPARRDFIPEKRVQRPLTSGSSAVAGVPVGYELRTDAHLRSGATPQSAGVQTAAIDLPGKDEPLDRREGALRDAETKHRQLEKAATELQAPAAADDGPARNKARLGLEMVAKNADALGDHDAYRQAVGKAADQRTTLTREIERAQELRTSDPAGAATRLKAPS